MRKLFHYGFDNSALDLIANFFINRTQTVKFNDKNSILSINLGVLQVSMIGPLFFLIFINDLALSIEFLTRMFADDTTLLMADKELKNLIELFSKRLEPVLDWWENNKLDLNWSKFMFITNK